MKTEFKGLPGVFRSITLAYAEENWRQPILAYNFPDFGPYPNSDGTTLGNIKAWFPSPDPNHSAVYLETLDPAAAYTIEALVLPNGHSELTTKLGKGEWASIGPYITDFFAYLRDTGWIVEQAPDRPAVEPQPVAILQPQSALSDREREVFNLAMEGMNRKEIAEKLMIEADTVDSTIRNICAKLKLPKKTKSTDVLRRLMNDG